MAAAGDDDPDSTIKDRRVNEKHILNIEGTTLWLMHQLDYPYTIDNEILPWWLGAKKNEIPDAVIFGHTHHALLEQNEDILIVNPGSPTFPGTRHKLGTVALLTISSGKVEAEIIQLH